MEEPIQKELEDLRDKFSNPHIYYVGSYTNCSCGFDLPSDQLENPVWEDAKRSVARLIDLIKLKSRWGNLEFYCCWAGNTASAVEEHVHLKAGSTSLDSYFGLTENQLIIFEA
ncbi:hypothetical protein [Larkinella arboricola]|uniref:hypothetical protein n=1 Tax=Larkinella arboricola TaxID=643671 RepID=UPI0011BA939A|nr:hypothetical protein [Larkinella arboricola]